MTPSSKCAMAFSFTYQMTSPRTKVPTYRADIVHGISQGAGNDNHTRASALSHAISDPGEIMAGTEFL